MKNYVFGYGSLLERASRTRTNPEAVGAWPARVTGYQRGWFHQFADNVGSTCTYLGAEKVAGKTINGVVYPVNDIEATKQRETGYTAVPLTTDDIKMLDGCPPLTIGADVQVYIFVSNPASISKTKEPTPTFPMVQSYVDICINGCLELEALYREVNGSFTKEFISTTTGWNAYWVNDRIYPRRPFIYAPNASAIDRALKAGNVLQYVQLHDLGVQIA
ncbi:MAG TPA: gamma-glutamylcyclotransferase family protein [Vicinamibacterales bacterium]|nr:gamma-glutamylcyclotransferase family protein [Vicinamibacterales bacterium]